MDGSWSRCVVGRCVNSSIPSRDVCSLLMVVGCWVYRLCSCGVLLVRIVREMREIYYMIVLMVVFVVAMFAICENIYMFHSTRMMAYLYRTAILMAIMAVCVIVFRLIYIDLFL